MRVETKFGTIYMEDLDETYDCESVEFMDSDGNFLDRWPIEIFDDITVKEVVDKISKFDTPQELLQYMSINYMLVTKDLYSLYDFMIKTDMIFELDRQRIIDTMEDGGDLTDDVAMMNEWVNHIGNYYIIVDEY